MAVQSAPQTIQTTRFGTLQFAPERVIRVLGGLIGFPQYESFFIFDPTGQGKMVWLQSAEEGSLAFPLLDPSAVWPDYLPEVAAEDLAALQLATLDEVIVMAVMVLHQQHEQITANLLAPLVINPAARLGKQVLLDPDRYSTKAPVFASVREA